MTLGVDFIDINMIKIFEAPAEAVRLTGGWGADVVIDTTGTPDALNAAIEMLRPGGRIAPYAVSHHACSGFSTFPLYQKEISIIASRALTDRDMLRAVELVATGEVDVSGFVSDTYPLRRTAQVFEDYERAPERVLRIVIESSN
jgi:L-iditol 2-dehydrogenase